MSTFHPLVVVTPPEFELDLSGLDLYVDEASELVQSGEQGAESTG